MKKRVVRIQPGNNMKWLKNNKANYTPSRQLNPNEN
jgi:hypothetical protein